MSLRIATSRRALSITPLTLSACLLLLGACADMELESDAPLAIQASAMEDNGASGSGECVDNTTPVTIVPKAAWGGRPARSLRSRHTVRSVVFHHTVQPLVSSLRGSAAVRSAQDYHMDQKNPKWSDIGYHYIIDRTGKIHEGTDATRIGAHVAGHNTGKLGIAFVGNFEDGRYAGEPLGAAQKNAGARLLRHLADKHNIPLAESHVKGHDHYERGRVCPGANVSVQEIIDLAKADRICAPTGGNQPPPPADMQYELPDIPLHPQAQLGYKHLRLTHIEGDNFIVDAVYHQRAGSEKIWTNRANGDRVLNIRGAYGEPDVEQCGDITEKAAQIQPGGSATFDFPESLDVSSSFHIRGQSVSTLPDRVNCNTQYQARVKVEASVDGEEWDVIDPSARTNNSVAVTVNSFNMIEPEGNKANRKVTFRVDAPKGVVSVQYYAEQHRLGSSTKSDDGFVYTYDFQNTGKRLISAWGFDKFGRAIAKMDRFITITDGIDFITPTAGQKYKPDMLLKVAVTDDIRRVVYKVGGKVVGESSDKSNNFQIQHFFADYGRTMVEAIGYDRNGQEYAKTQVTFEVSESGDNFRIATPRGESAYTRSVDFSVESSSPNVARVQYKIDGIHSIGTSSDAASGFAINYNFTDLGRRKVEALGFTEEGDHIETDTLFIVVTEDDGTAPPDGDYDPSQDPNSPESTGIARNDALANRLAVEATKLRDRNGAAPVGTGYCYKFVKAAMHRAGVPQDRGYNASFEDMDAGACDAINARNSANLTMTNSAMCFGRNAAANPSGLFEEFGMQQVIIPVTDALPGDVITYDSRCISSVHGHIEIVDPNGNVCSDFCTPLSRRASITKCTPQIWRVVTEVSGGNQPPTSSTTRVGSSCFFNGQEGTCLRNGSSCGGVQGQSTCSAGQTCCVKGCSVNGAAGQCINTSSCGGTTTSNLCPGPSDVRCCTP